MDISHIYQRVGEFTISYQFIEHQLRQIGWFILDPNRKIWPPRALRDLSSSRLAGKVHSLFKKAIPFCRLENENQLQADFANSIKDFHTIRKIRNNILHSVYIEIKAGDEIVGLMRSNPVLKVDSNSGVTSQDQEMLSDHSFDNVMRQMALVSFQLGRSYMQLVQRLPENLQL